MKIKYLLSALILTTSVVCADSYVYITDQVDIPMRSDKSFADNILRSLPSGSKMAIIQATEDGWTQVKIDGVTGWVISRYLSNHEPARAQLEKLRQSYNANKLIITKQSERNKELEEQVLKLRNENTKLSVQGSKFKSEKEHVEQVYKDALKLEHANEKLKSKALELKSEIQLLKSNQTIDKDASSRNWFIVGAIVLFFGIIIGFILPNFINRRRF